MTPAIFGMMGRSFALGAAGALGCAAASFAAQKFLETYGEGLKNKFNEKFPKVKQKLDSLFTVKKEETRQTEIIPVE